MVHSRLLLLWYSVIGLLFFELFLFWATGQLADLMEKKHRQLFIQSMQVWQPAGEVAYAAHINRFSEQYGVSARLVALVIEAESSFQPQAVSKAGAYGLMQIIPGTWKQVNQQLEICKGRHTGECTTKCYFDPEINIHVGTAYLSQLVKRYNGNSILAVAAYNAGPGSVDRYGGVPDFPETREYVTRIIANWEKKEPSRYHRIFILNGENWAILHRRVGWAWVMTLLFAAIINGYLYKRHGCWRWR